MKPLSKFQRKQHPVLFGVPRMAPILQHLLELRQILDSSSGVFNKSEPPVNFMTEQQRQIYNAIVSPLEIPPEVFCGDNGSLVINKDGAEYFLQRSSAR